MLIGSEIPPQADIIKFVIAGGDLYPSHNTDIFPLPKKAFCWRVGAKNQSRVQKFHFNQHKKAAKASQRHSPLILIPLTYVLHWDSVPNPDTPCGLCVLHVFAVANTRTRPVV